MDQARRDLLKIAAATVAASALGSRQAAAPVNTSIHLIGTMGRDGRRIDDKE